VVRIIRDNKIGRDGFFTRQINTYLQTKSNFDYPRDRIIRPSEITECTRAIVCKLLGFSVREVITPRQQRIFDNGNYVHKRYLKSYIPHMGWAAKVEVDDNGKTKIKDFIEVTAYNEELWLKGTPDAVIINKEDGLPYIFELKSIKQELFFALEQPDWGYMAQVHLYMLLTGIPRAIVFYENKNDQDIKEFLVLQDPHIMELLLNKIKEIQTYVLNYEETKLLPPFCMDKYCMLCKNERINK